MFSAQYRRHFDFFLYLTYISNCTLHTCKQYLMPLHYQILLFTALGMTKVLLFTSQGAFLLNTAAILFFSLLAMYFKLYLTYLQTISDAITLPNTLIYSPRNDKSAVFHISGCLSAQYSGHFVFFFTCHVFQIVPYILANNI